MKTRKHRKKRGGGKKWRTALGAAQTTLRKTGSLNKARQSLKSQALANARKIFGSVG